MQMENKQIRQESQNRGPLVRRGELLDKGFGEMSPLIRIFVAWEK